MSLGGLYTDADADTDDMDDDDNDNNTQWTEHDCIGSLPNEPKNVTLFLLNNSFSIIDRLK